MRDQKRDEEALYLLEFFGERTAGVGRMFGKMLKGKAEDSARQDVEDYLQASQAAIGKHYRDALRRPRN